jgi:Protein of unknown function (DUF3313)
MKTAIIARLSLTFFTVLGLGSCGIKKATTAPEPTRFLQATGTDVSHRVERLPFQHSWRDPKVNLANYKNIVLRPVTTAFLRRDSWQESKSSFIPNKRTYTRRCGKLARYWDRSLAKSFASPICLFYKTRDTSAAGTLVLEVALTEVRFDRATGTAAVPAGSLASVVTGLPICAFEARVRDASSGRLIATAADRRGPKITVIDSGKNTFTKSNEAICDEWADQLMKSPNIELFPKVRRSWFSLF